MYLPSRPFRCEHRRVFWWRPRPTSSALSDSLFVRNEMDKQKVNRFTRMVVVLVYSFNLISALLIVGFVHSNSFAFGYHVGDMFLYLLIFSSLFVSFLVMSVLVIFEYVSSLGKLRDKGMSLIGLVLRSSVLVIAILAFLSHLFFPVLFRDHFYGIDNFHKGFYYRVKGNIDLVQIQEWLNDMDEDIFDKWSDYSGLGINDPINIPKDIFSFKPEISYITLSKNDQGIRYIDLEWGGPPGRWGVVVGAEGIEIPPSDTERYGRYRYDFDSTNDVYSWMQIR